MAPAILSVTYLLHFDVRLSKLVADIVGILILQSPSVRRTTTYLVLGIFFFVYPRSLRGLTLKFFYCKIVVMCIQKRIVLTVPF